MREIKQWCKQDERFRATPISTFYWIVIIKIIITECLLRLLIKIKRRLCSRYKHNCYKCRLHNAL